MFTRATLFIPGSGALHGTGKSGSLTRSYLAEIIPSCTSWSLSYFSLQGGLRGTPRCVCRGRPQTPAAISGNVQHEEGRLEVGMLTVRKVGRRRRVVGCPMPQEGLLGGKRGGLCIRLVPWRARRFGVGSTPGSRLRQANDCHTYLCEKNYNELKEPDLRGWAGRGLSVYLVDMNDIVWCWKINYDILQQPSGSHTRLHRTSQISAANAVIVHHPALVKLKVIPMSVCGTKLIHQTIAVFLRINYFLSSPRNPEEHVPSSLQ